MDSDRPLYGVYKAVEELANALGKGARGRRKLAELARYDKKYVDEVIETAQTKRHYSGYKARRRLSDAECRDRAKHLIEAYAQEAPNESSDPGA